MVATGMFKQVEAGVGVGGYQRDVESHNGGLGAGYLNGCVHMRWILKV